MIMKEKTESTSVTTSPLNVTPMLILNNVRRESMSYPRPKCKSVDTSHSPYNLKRSWKMCDRNNPSLDYVQGGCPTF